MKTDKHGNGNGIDDLYILPESQAEQLAIVAFLKSRSCSYEWSHSNVSGQDWYGKTFIDVPFGESLLPELLQHVEQSAAG